MLKSTLIFFIIILALALQITASVNLFPSYAVGDIFLILVVLWTAKNGFEKMWPRVLLAGIAADIANFRILGESVIVLVAVSYLISFSARRFLIAQRAWKLFFLVTMTVLGALLSQSLLYLLSIYIALAEKSVMPVFSEFWGTVTVYKILADILILMLLYWPIKKIENLLSFGEQSIIARK